MLGTAAYVIVHSEDMFAPESIDLLQKSGIDLQRHEEMGIEPNDFAELMITSGLVLTPDTKWISFHSGYDFGYFVKLLTGQSLPTNEETFFDTLHTWFPTIYDIKFVMRSCKVLKGGLQDVADDLGVVRIGPSHQAGSDSLLTASTFFKMREEYFNDTLDDPELSGKLYGLGQTFTLQNGVAETVRAGTAATIAEREDRAGPSLALAGREAHNQTPGPAGPPGHGVMGMGGALTTPVMAGAMPAQMPTTPYGPMANGPYMRTPIGVGGGR
ncbi:hypothetical protein GSI_15543 [Ganoderma sinense ZZ0214-1]|uniref:poly(A)-specific ribonuclease n=1 Tax=Ganoderma sinense ZZ0214-1 TaxID=1077348 RepID=A0A2G8RNF7_9APHY|nr:hypothetical protein GSI_15543 [Ganoderma sinense ZZ0214-1]